MPDYIYLLENRLSADQQSALRHLREAAREAGMILFLTGDAVRDLTSGHAVRELEVAVHGNALELKGIIQSLGAHVWGEDQDLRSLYLCFPGTVRVDVVGTHRVEYPMRGEPVIHPASIQEDLRRRDFTVNAMAISLNEGSFGLLMDPLNGAADIESRTLRLVSNYGFIEEPSLLIRATRYQARLGWEFDPRTQARYENAKADGAIERLSAQARSRELEQIGHEDEALKVLRALEAEGWMKVLFPAWTAAKADEEKLQALHELAIELLIEGVHADMSAAQMQLLTAKLAAKELATLKKQMLRPGFVEEWNSLDALAAGFAKVLLAKENSTPSVSYKLFTSYDPEAILWLGFTSKDEAVRERFKLFLKLWPEARQRIPHALMQEMRITDELANYREIVLAVFMELIDGRLTTLEEMRAFLQPHSPPAPPPQVTIKRPRAKRGSEAKIKDSFDDDEDDDDEEEDEDEDLDDIGGDEDESHLEMNLPKMVLGSLSEKDEDEEDDLEDEGAGAHPAPVKNASRQPAAASKPAPRTPTPVQTATAKTKMAVDDAPDAKPAASGPRAAEKHKPIPQPKAGAKSEVGTKSNAEARPRIEAKPPIASHKKAEMKPKSQAHSKAEPKSVPAPAAKSSKNAAKAATAKERPKNASPASKAPAKTAAKVAARPVAKAAAKAAPTKEKPASAATSKAARAVPAKPHKTASKDAASRSAKKH